MWLHVLAAILYFLGAQGSFEVEVAGLKVRGRLLVVPWSDGAACFTAVAGLSTPYNVTDAHADSAPV